MAAGSLLALLDDIATLLDDVSVMTKVAAQKTAGVLGDDLAVNAEKVSGVNADRELPVVWAVTVGSLRNKLILVPAALAISYFLPWLITPLLMLGGAYLCFEGFEKIAHKSADKTPSPNASENQSVVIDSPETPPNVGMPSTDSNQPQKIEIVENLATVEKEKIQGAVRTDFILSAEIIVIALGTVADKSFAQQAVVVALVAIVLTFVVYGLVAMIIKLDDAGLYLIQRRVSGFFSAIRHRIGHLLLAAAPALMRFLSFAGTVAMFMVGGSIIGHGIPFLHHLFEQLNTQLHGEAIWQNFLAAVLPHLLDIFVGLLVGTLCFMLMHFIKRPLSYIFSSLKK